MVNFLIVGANKAGTTSLYFYLNQHPEIFLSNVKEPMFFNHYFNQKEDSKFRTSKVIRSKKSYHKLFEDAKGNYKLLGEASTSYLANPSCSTAIYDYNPNMKIIILLRNPIERAYSNYLMYVRLGIEKRSFRKAIKDNLARRELQQGQKYVDLGMYSSAVKIYLETFNDVKIILFDDFIKNTQLELSDIYNFLNVKNDFLAKVETRFNNNDNVEIRLHMKIIKKITQLLNLEEYFPAQIKSFYKRNRLKMSENDKDFLKKIYEKDVRDLSKILNTDLSHWLR